MQDKNNINYKKNINFIKIMRGGATDLSDRRTINFDTDIKSIFKSILKKMTKILRIIMF